MLENEMAWLEPVQDNGAVRLQNIFVHVTKACNLACRYCYFSANKPLPDELTAEEWRRVWPEVASIRPVKLVITGGEPLLRPDLFQLLQQFSESDPEHHVIRCLNTNGHLISAANCERLVSLVDEVRVSIDALAERNDTLRGTGNFVAAMAAVEQLQSVGFEPKVLVTLTSHSLPDLEPLIELLLDRGVRRINLNPFRAIGRGRTNRSWQVDFAAAEQAFERVWKRLFPAAAQACRAAVASPPRNCGVGQYLNILPDGRVYPCHVLMEGDYFCGNVREQSLLDICDKNGLVGHLAQLNFSELANRDVRLMPLSQGRTCLAEHRASEILPAYIPASALCRTSRE